MICHLRIGSSVVLRASWRLCLRRSRFFTVRALPIFRTWMFACGSAKRIVLICGRLFVRVRRRSVMRVLIDGSREGFSGVLVRTDTVESVTLIADRWTDEECNGYGDSYSDRVSVGFEVLDCSGVASKG